MSLDPGMIDWVVDEVHDSLQHVSGAFREYLASPDDLTSLRIAATHLHQAQGTLQMVELDAPAALLTEAEMLIQRQLNGKLDSFDSFKNELLKSILVVDDCITRLNSGTCDDQQLLDMMNSLREQQDKPAVSRFSFFRPDLSAYQLQQNDESGQVLDIEPLHQKFQRALLQWLQKPADASPLRELAEILDQLELNAQFPTLGLLWASAAGLIEAVETGGLEASADIKKMMGDIERRIKRIADDGQAAVLRDNPETLIRGLLFELIDAEKRGDRGEKLLTALDLLPSDSRRVDETTSVQLKRLQEIQLELENQVATARLFLNDYYNPEQDEPQTLQPLCGLLAELTQSVAISDDRVSGLESLLEALQQACETYVAGQIECSGETVALYLAEGLLVLETSARDAAANYAGWQKRILRASENLRRLMDAGDSAEKPESRAPLPADADHHELLVAVANEIRESLGVVEQSVTRFSQDTDQLENLVAAQNALHEISGALEILDRKGIAQLARELRETITRIRQGHISPQKLLLESIALSAGAIEASVAALEHERPDVEALSISALEDLRNATSRVENQPQQSGNWIVEIGELLGQWLDKPDDDAIRDKLLHALESSRDEAFEKERVEIIDTVRKTGQKPESLDDKCIASLQTLFQTITQRSVAQSDFSQPPASSAARTGADKAPAGIDPEVQKVFVRETHEHLKTIKEIPEAEGDLPIPYKLRRAVHALAGASAALGIMPMAEASGSLETLLDTFDGTNKELGPAQKVVLGDYHEAVRRLLESLNGKTSWREVTDRFAEINSLVKTQIVGNAEGQEVASHRIREHIDLTDVYRDEVRQLLSDFQNYSKSWSTGGKSNEPLRNMVRVMHTIKGGARVTNLDGIARLAYSAERFLRRLNHQKIHSDQALADLLAQVTHVLHDGSEQIGKGGAGPDVDNLVQQLDNSYQETGMVSDRRSELFANTDPAEPPAQSDLEISEHRNDEIIAIFLDEADDILKDMEGALKRLDDGDNAAAMKDLKRQFHTLKGGARMVGLSELGDLTHGVESMLQADLDQGGSLDKRRLSLLHEIRTEIIIAMESVRDGSSPSLQSVAGKVNRLTSVKLIDDADEVDEVEDSEPIPEPQDTLPADAAASTPDLSKEIEKIEQAQVFSEPKISPLIDLPARSKAVRVDIDTLDTLVNQVSEMGVSRSRLRLQFSGFVGFLDEMQSVVERFRDYFRDFEIEAETAIVSSPGQELSSMAPEFDPLELDRFSRLQQLTRSLSECVDDLSNVESGMERVVWQAETLFHNEARTYARLHEGLLKTRMQPVGILAGRLQHLVRTISKETGKKADLEIFGQEVELDRNIIERMAAPLEHMIRNALVHGIEPTKNREQLGKPGWGHIRIEFDQVYNEVIMRFSDDGAGINLVKLRQKAVSAGLANKEISDQDLTQLVLQSGVSTDDKVSQLSGRGVGMEIVASEIRYLGGHIDVKSRAGKGVTFIINIPLSLSVTRATLVRCDDQMLAVPLSSIVQIQTLSGEEISRMRIEENPFLIYRGNKYRFSMLSDRIGLDTETEHIHEVPVLLLRSGKRCIALAVDEVMDTEECVIKPLNPQLSGVRCVTGATILGSGDVALLLDPGNLRRELPSNVKKNRLEITVPASLNISPQPRARLLIVDDSVTVRKVTGRLMERNGFVVDLARDGFDALKVLDQRKPDLMLIDIEMPKMDGYELMEEIRKKPELADIPAIVVTSRSGGKHRKKALDLGAADYFSKPYEESALINRINTILRKRKTHG